MYPRVPPSSGPCAWRILWLAITCCIGLWGGTVRVLAQNPTAFHLSKSNGLPSNNVYFFLQDRLGYLWIATDKGVVKYNGYTSQLFNKAEGLPTDDTWAIIDDDEGRLWVGGSSGQMGYIRNNKYQNATLPNVSATIFPYHLHRFHSGIIFYSPYISGNNLPSICISRNDTIYPYTITESLLDKNDKRHNEIAIFLNDRNVAYATYSDKSYEITNLESIPDTSSRLRVRRLNDVTNIRFYEYDIAGIRLLCNKSFIIYSPGTSNQFLVHNIITNKSDTVRLSDLHIGGQIKYISYSLTRGHEQQLLVFTNEKCILFDVGDQVSYVGNVDLLRITGQKNGRNDLLHYSAAAMWDTLVATKANGIFHKSRFTDSAFKIQAEIDFGGYTCVGTVYDSLTWWWNSEQKTLLCYSKSKKLHSFELKNTSITHVAPFSKDTLLFMGAYSQFFTLPNQQFHRIKLGHFGASLKRIYEYAPKCFLILSKSGVYNIRPNFNQDSLSRVFIDIDRFDDAVEDRFRKKLIAWNDTKMLICDENVRQTVKAQQIGGNANAHIQTVCTEPVFGNVFVKTNDQLLFFDPVTGKKEFIHSNINYKNTTIAVWKNYLVVTGDFGVSFFLIKGLAKLSQPITYLNLKKAVYKEILSYSIESGVLTLQTDMGAYAVKLPAEEVFLHNVAEKLPYTVIIQDSIQHVLAKGDTVRLANNTRILYTDVINPLGNGNLRMYYRVGNTKEWTKCVGNEIIRPDFVVPDKYYTLEIYCEDDGWRSDVITATVWVQPTWWQKRSSKYIIWFGAVLLVVLVIVVSVAITNRLVLKVHQKKQMQMELELKAIYSQINPHFIFNALTSAMLLIKKNKTDEAYTHVAKFSRLLRSYLNSSRSKYITIADEIANLTNYMELQQTRFKDRFESIITIEENLDTNNLIPSLLIQPFVENAINHGVLPSEQTGRVEVSFLNRNDGIRCIVSDNGIGRHASRLSRRDRDPTHGSFGNLLIKDLVKVFDKYEEMKINITYEDRLEPNAGTDVIIDIKYIQPVAISNNLTH